MPVGSRQLAARSAHWSEAYLTLKWTPETDCGWLIEKVRREVFGHDIQLTAHRREGPFGRNAQIRAEVSCRATRTDTPADGDIVLMICKARAQHVGLYCVIAGEAWILHNQQGAGVRLMRLRDLDKWGYRIEGYYRWI